MKKNFKNINLIYKIKQMAEIKKLAPWILKWEGGFVNDPLDKGGATNKGVTIAVWKSQGYDKDGDRDIDVADLKLITVEDATNIMKKNYWDRWKADQIKNQAIANTLVDWVWGSGAWGIKIPQRILGVKDDGVVGGKTLEALNKQNPKEFLEKLYLARFNFLDGIVASNPSQKRFIKGWKNRMNDLILYNKKFV